MGGSLAGLPFFIFPDKLNKNASSVLKWYIGGLNQAALGAELGRLVIHNFKLIHNFHNKAGILGEVLIAIRFPPTHRTE